MVDIDRDKLDFVDADVLVNKQSAEIVFTHRRIIFQYAQLRKICKLLRSMKDFIRKLFRVRRTDFGFVVFQKGQKLMRLVMPLNSREEYPPCRRAVRLRNMFLRRRVYFAPCAAFPQ